MYDSRLIANYFIDFARKDGVAISPMKLQKLVYFAHGYYLAITGQPLIEEEIQAWRYGPQRNS
ncbi:MAG: Panacea domain-containing protein, partial [bacterium]